MVFFGQVVIGTAGSGKTTYCQAMSTVLAGLKRHVLVVNLDAANDGNVPYTAAASVSELVEGSEAARRGYESLGPNGAVMYTMELLERNLGWLDRVVRAAPSRAYFVFDCPGQLELYTHHASLARVLAHLQQRFDMRLCAVHLLDSVLCADASTFVAGLVTSLTAMLNLALPHVNVLTKVDLLPGYGPLPFDLEYLEEGQDLQYLAHAVCRDRRFAARYGRLTEALCGVVEDYGLVSYVAMSVTNATSVHSVLALVDKANGYAVSGLDPTEDPAFLLQAASLFDAPLGELGEEQGALLLEAVQECYDVHEAALEAQRYSAEHPDDVASDSDSEGEQIPLISSSSRKDNTLEEEKEEEEEGGEEEEEDDIGQPPPLEYTQ